MSGGRSRPPAPPVRTRAGHHRDPGGHPSARPSRPPPRPTRRDGRTARLVRRPGHPVRRESRRSWSVAVPHQRRAPHCDREACPLLPPRLRWRERTHPWCIALLRRLRVERRANGEASSVMARAQRSASIRGSCSGRGHSTVGVLRLSWLEAGVANDDFRVHASRPLIEALIRTAGRLAPSRGSCRGVAGAA
jgi:hypothetical protein